MTVFQTLTLLFALLMLYVVIIHYKKKTLGLGAASFWASLWVIFIVISLFPNLLLGITGALNFSRVFDLLVVIAFMIISLVVFLSYFRVRELEKKLEKYVRSDALKSGQKND